MSHNTFHLRLRARTLAGCAAAGTALLLTSAWPASAAEDLTTDNYRAPSPITNSDLSAYEY
ncbi:hypothetical protein, partial [Haloactinopolyspora sp.]|uniref:hypothetical protein n=1 Tax=Haloactinopolyspora sp. TaxID=1966353 RepID=UPI00262D2D64